MGKGEECWVSPDGIIHTKDGIYCLENGELCRVNKDVNFRNLAELEYDLVKTLYGEKIPKYPDLTLEGNGWIQYTDIGQPRWIKNIRWNVPFCVPTSKQIAAAFARTGDKIGNEEES